MAAAASTFASLDLWVAATAIVAMCFALIVVTATAAFDFGNFHQAAGSQFGQGLFYGRRVRIENPDATTAQSVKQATANSSGANDGIDVWRRRMAGTGTGIDAEAFAAIAVDQQQSRCSAKVRRDLGTEAIDLADWHTDLHVDKSSRGGKTASARYQSGKLELQVATGLQINFNFRRWQVIIYGICYF
jgi:hypothetical protein